MSDLDIVGVAIWWEGQLYTLPAPNRHGDVIHLIHEETGDMGIFGNQGFVLRNGAFIGRGCGLLVAQITGQFHRERPANPYMLFSEDLW